MILSIMILSVPSRRKTFLQDILDKIETQIANSGRTDVEVLVLYDNKKRTVGEKRNNLLDMAKGKYSVFIDDDDMISDDYLSSILSVLDYNSLVECVAWKVACTIDNGVEIICEYDFCNQHGVFITQTLWKGKPTHTHVYLTSISKEVRYKDISMGEDADWINRVASKVKNLHKIDKVLYYYKFNSNTTETRNG